MTQTRPTRRERRDQAEDEKHPSTGRVELEDIDSVLDGIDEILEENELEVTRSYLQRGGQ